jgi:hypothetical protein
MFKVKREKGPGWTVLANLIKDSKQKKVLKVGFIGDTKYPNKNFTTAGAAYVSEFGNATKNIPPRPFMGPAVQKNREKWRQLMQSLYKSVLTGKLRFWTVFDQVGLVAAGAIKEEIRAVNSPPLKLSTIKARLRGKKQGKYVALTITKPLVHTKLMLNSVTHVIENEE